LVVSSGFRFRLFDEYQHSRLRHVIVASVRHPDSGSTLLILGTPIDEQPWRKRKGLLKSESGSPP